MEENKIEKYCLIMQLPRENHDVTLNFQYLHIPFEKLKYSKQLLHFADKLLFKGLHRLYVYTLFPRFPIKYHNCNVQIRFRIH